VNNVPRKKTAEWREICPISLRNLPSGASAGGGGNAAIAVSGILKCACVLLCHLEVFSDYRKAQRKIVVKLLPIKWAERRSGAALRGAIRPRYNPLADVTHQNDCE
jgi:hypothetical protein